MAWFYAIIAIGAAIYAYSRIPKPQAAPPPSLDELDAPTAEEGRSIPVLFGRRRIKSPNVVWYGDLETSPVRQKVKGFLGSKYQNTGQYKVNLGMHMAIGIGPFDSIDKIEVGDQIAWDGYSTGGQIYINKPDLFGGQKKQGGIVGYVDIEFGESDQPQNDYLVSVLGEDIPAYRGVVGAVLRQVYLGTTNYIKPWIFWGSRIHKRSDGTEQWYDEKSEIFPRNAESYNIYVDAKENSGIDSSNGVVINGLQSDKTYIVYLAEPLTAYSYHPSDAAAAIDGVDPWHNRLHITTTSGTLVYGGNPPGTAFPDGGYDSQDQAISGFPFIQLTGFTSYTFWIYDTNPPDNRGGMSLLLIENIYGDMNPSHIIREALTDRKFALRYSDSQINDDSFSASADQLYSEGLGMSLYWTGENSIEEFIGEVLRHIDGNCYVDKKTGQWVLSLVRDDYDVESLPLLNESNIVSVSNYKQPTISELTNSITVGYWDATTGENSSLTIQDPVLIDLQGGIVNQTIQYPGFTNHDAASRSSLRDLRALSTPRISCTITCDRSAAELNIGDPFLMDWPDLNINNKVMRVDSISLGDMEKAEIVIDCVEDVFSAIGIAGSSPIAAPTPGLWVDPTIGEVDAANPRIAMEAPYQFIVDSIGKSDTDSAISLDSGFGISFISAGRQGSELIADVMVDDGSGYIDTGDMDFAPWAEIESVTRTQSKIYVVGISKDMTRLNFPNLGSINDEIVIVDEYSEDSGGKYFNVRRGALDSIPSNHDADSSGQLILLIWEEYAQSDEISRSESDSVDIKLITKNGNSALSIADAPMDTVIFGSRAVRPYPPANVKLNDEYWPALISGDLEITARQRNRLTQAGGVIVGFFEDYDVVDEDGQTYSYELYDTDTDTLIDSSSGITSFPINISAAFLADFNRLEIFAERDGHESFSRLIFEFTTLGGSFESEDGLSFESESSEIFEVE